MEDFLNRLSARTIFLNHTAPKYEEMLSSTDDSVVMSGLQQLCDQLNMSTVMPLFRLNVAGIVPCIVKSLQRRDYPDMNLLAARVLTYMADTFPPAVMALSEPESVDALLSPLRMIEDVELAEQCLACIGKICDSPYGALSIFSANGISAMMSFSDFFTITSQRKIWSNTARICSYVNPGSFPLVREVLPTLRAGVASDDIPIRCKAITALTCIIRGVHEQRDLVDEAFGDLGTLLLELLLKQEKEESFVAALTLIHTAVSWSDKVIKKVVDSDLITVLLALLHDATATTGTGSDGPSPSVSPHSPLSPESPVSADVTSEHSTLTRDRRHKSSIEDLRRLSSIFRELLPAMTDGNAVPLEQLRQKEFKEPEERSSGDDDNDEEEEESDEEETSESEAEDSEGPQEESDRLEHNPDRAITNPNSARSPNAHSRRSSPVSPKEAEMERLHQRVRESGVKLNVHFEHRRIRSRTCSCDGCGAILNLHNWYHCNRCPNFDYCATCLIAQWRDHYRGEHTFTDMSEIKRGNQLEALTRLEVENGKQSVYHANPKLLAVVLRAVPGAVRLSAESEVPLIRYYCVEFLARAVNTSSTQQLLDCGIASTNICETIRTALKNPYLLTYLGVFIAKKLVEKIPKIYTELLVREGVTHQLVQMKSSHPPAKRQRSDSDATLPSTSWWRETTMGEASHLLEAFPLHRMKEHSTPLQKVCRQLKEKKLKQAFAGLREVLLEDITAFEIMSSNLVHHLTEALTHSNGIVSIVALVHVLSLVEGKLVQGGAAAAAPPTTPLLKLIRHLQGILSQLDMFKSPTFGVVENTQSKISISLVADHHRHNSIHSTSSGHLSGSSNNSNEERASPRGGGRGSTNVAVEPLADIETIGTFVAQKLLKNNRNLRGPATQQGGDNSDEDASDEASPTTAGSSRSVWFRYKSKVLPPSMTMVQLIQMIMDTQPHSGGASSSSASLENSARDAGLNRHHSKKSNDTALLGSNGKNIVLFYSESAYTGSQYEFLSVMPSVPPEVARKDHIEVTLPSQDCFPSAAGPVIRQLQTSFPWSSRFLNAEQKEVLALLGMLCEVNHRWSEIAPHVQDEVRKELKGVKLPSCSGDTRSLLATPAIPSTEFCHQKLNNKAMRHCSNFLLAGQHLRTWAVNLALDCPFLFLPSTRKFMFDISFCGTTRSIVRMQQRIGDYGVLDRSSVDHSTSRSFRLRRDKKRVWRDSPLDCALKIFNGPRTSGSVALDIEFFGEEGMGQGPTREFFTLVAESLRLRKLNLWRSSDEPPEAKFFTPTNGLYPRLTPTDSPATTVDVGTYFHLIGRFLAHALLDDHVPGLHLSPALIRLLRGDCCSVQDIQDIDPSVYRLLDGIIRAHRAGTSMIQLSGQKKAFPMESMGLDFTMEENSLLPHGAGEGIEVSASNMMEYCDAMVLHILRHGVERAVTALRNGFDDYIPLYSLRILSVEEIQEVLKGHDRIVTRQEFVENCLADHGYTLSSRPVQWLFDILSSFSVEDQKTFFLFLTGSMNLPIGGLSSLHPKLTIVRKSSSESNAKDCDLLPSAMTCQNYLKLPSYETVEQMEAKIRQAMEEGKGSFHLT